MTTRAQGVLFKDQAMNASVNSDWIEVGEAKAGSISVEWTDGTGADGEPAGNFILQVSNDQTIIHDEATQAAGGDAGKHLFKFTDPPYKYVRLRWDDGGSSLVTDLFTANYHLYSDRP